MIRLEPLVHATIWGGRRLSKYLDENGSKPCRIGHLYLINGHRGMTNIVSEGKWRGVSLRDVFDEEKILWGLEAYDEFPLTIALVDATQSLSIQVHPDDETAQRLEGIKIGKEESWYFLEGPEMGFIYYGCGTNEIKDVSQAVCDKHMEEITGKEKVEATDYVCVKAGMLHAMTSGCLAYEVEYGGDITYRFYDYDRRDSNGKARELHIEKALEAIHTDVGKRVVRKSEGEWLKEENYEIMIKRDIHGYMNEGDCLECVADIERGRGTIIFPGERMEEEMSMAIIARLRK